MDLPYFINFEPTKDESIKQTIRLIFDIMQKRDAVVLAGILVGISIPVMMVVFMANGIIENPIP